MTDKVAPEKISLLRAYGAEVIVCPVAVPPEDPQSYYKVAERLTDERNAFRPNQYANPNNPLAHEKTTGPGDVAARPPVGSPTSSPARARAAPSPAPRAT